MAAVMRKLFFILTILGPCFDMIIGERCDWFWFPANSKRYLLMKCAEHFQDVSEKCKYYSKVDVILRTNEELFNIEDELFNNNIEAIFWIQPFNNQADGLYWKDEKILEELLTYPANDSSSDPCMNLSHFFRAFHYPPDTPISDLPPSCQEKLRYICQFPEPETEDTFIARSTEVTTQKLTEKSYTESPSSQPQTSSSQPQTPSSQPPTSMSNPEATSTHVIESLKRAKARETTGPSITTSNSPPTTASTLVKERKIVNPVDPDYDTMVLEAAATVFESEPASTEQATFPMSSSTSNFQSVTSSPLEENQTQGNGFCHCLCPANALDNEDSEDSVHKTIGELKVNVSTLSATIRRHTSAHDPRPSASFISVPILILVVTSFLLIVCSDFVNLYHFVKNEPPHSSKLYSL